MPLEITVETTTKLYTKTFTQETWDKLDFPIPELGHSMTMQKSYAGMETNSKANSCYMQK